MKTFLLGCTSSYALGCGESPELPGFSQTEAMELWCGVSFRMRSGMGELKEFTCSEGC